MGVLGTGSHGGSRSSLAAQEGLVQAGPAWDGGRRKWRVQVVMGEAH
jgi:hypothetical protein